MYRLVYQTVAAQPTYVGYVLFIGGLLLTAGLMWRLSRFNARRPT